MTKDEARKLADEITDTWPTGTAKTYIWTRLLTPLHHPTARHAYQACIQECRRPPTTGEYLTAYRAARQHTNRPDPNPISRTPHVQAWLDTLNLDDTTPLPADDPKAVAAFAIGYTRGVAELDAERTDESA